jgi:hypothetical protein
MKRVAMFFAVLGVAFVLALAGCGSKQNPAQTAATMVMLQTGDASSDQIVKFELTISSVTLTGTGGTPNTANLLGGPAEVEFTHQAGTFEPLSLSHVPPGTYSGATFTVSNPEVVAVISGAPVELMAALSSTTVSVSFNPNITIGNSPMFLNFDLDLANSVTISGSSAMVSPHFNVSTSTISPDENNEDDNNGGIEDVLGKVTAIASPNFTIQTNSTTLTFATNASTHFEDGISQLSDLKVGDIVEVDGITQSDGTALATQVEREENQNGEEVEGVISALDNPLTKITIVRQEDSTGSSISPLTVAIAVNSSTVYSTRTDKLNISAPPFDAAHIGKGQRIEADTGNNSSPLLATRIKLREQALIGTVAPSPAPTASGFTLNLSSTSAFGNLAGVTSIPISIVSGTELRNGISITPAATVRVRGLVFFNSGAYTMIATRIDNNN